MGMIFSISSGPPVTLVVVGIVHEEKDNFNDKGQWEGWGNEQGSGGCHPQHTQKVLESGSQKQVICLSQVEEDARANSCASGIGQKQAPQNNERFCV
jgi:hypothetical protein